VSLLARVRFRRPDRHVPIWLLALTLVVVASAVGPAWSARQLPAGARFGEIAAFQYPLVAIGKRTFRIAPGAKIYNQQNLIIMPAAMPGRGAVLFKLDTAGEISGIWLLTAEEAARAKKAAAKPAAPKADQGKDPNQDDPLHLGR
jgi:hypothetical protein